MAALCVSPAYVTMCNKFVVMLKRPQSHHHKPTKMSSALKAKQCGEVLETRVVSLGMSAPPGTLEQFNAQECA